MLSSLKGAERLYQYELLQDEYRPDLKAVKDLDEESCKIYDEEETIGILNKYYHMRDCLAEHNFAVAYNHNGNILGIYQISIGDYKSCSIYHRELAIFLALIGATQFKIFHNHPNNELIVSDADIGSAAALKTMGDIMEISFGGSYIVAKIGWKSTDDDDPVCNFYREEA